MGKPHEQLEAWRLSKRTHFINIARGSQSELDTQSQLAAMLGWLPEKHEIFELSDRVGRLLTGLHRKWSPE